MITCRGALVALCVLLLVYALEVPHGVFATLEVAQRRVLTSELLMPESLLKACYNIVFSYYGGSESWNKWTFARSAVRSLQVTLIGHRVVFKAFNAITAAFRANAK